MSRPPLSPLSMSSNDSAYGSRYGSMGAIGGAGPSPNNDLTYTGGPYGAARPFQASPPSSQHPSSSTDASRPSASSRSDRPPSSASSIAMSSAGPPHGRPPNSRDSTKSTFRPEGEEILQRHYGALRRYLAVYLQDEKGQVRPNRARDKLLRLSTTQFMELSTDVYDELMRREDERTQRVENVPRFLLPRQNFHPKRNQARQKLSTLPIERFRQLATDVFYELERRIPRLVGDGTSRPMSSNSNASSRSRAPSRGGMRPPPPGFGGPPFPPGGPRPRAGPGGSFGNGFPPPSPGGRRPSEAGSVGRPLPRTLQSNTIVPNKSTMVEDDDGDEEEDGYGLDNGGSAEDKEKIQAQDSEIAELKERLAEKESELQSHAEERDQWTGLREQLEQKHMDAQKLNDNLQNQLNQLALNKSQDHDQDLDHLRQQLDDHRADKEHLRTQLDDHIEEKRQLRSQMEYHQSERDQLRAQLDQVPEQQKVLLQQLETHLQEKESLHRELLKHQGNSGPEEYQRSLELLQEELATQERITNDVREEATLYLQEMRDLSRQNDQAIAQEEKLVAKVSQLEREIDDWRTRYARVKAQNKSLRASTMGLGSHSSFDAGSLVRQEGLISAGGLVRDTDVTRFQLAVDGLLKSARQTSTDAMLESVKDVIVSVQSITSTIGTDGYPTPSPSPLGPDHKTHGTPSVGKLKARVNGTANSLITATKQHAASHGLSPVALLDAAASNLTASVVELVKAVHIRPSTTSELQDVEAADELSSIYEEHLPVGSTADERFADDVSPHANMEVAAPTPPANPLKRSNTKKGWFGWGRGESVDETPATTPPLTAGNSDYDVSEYDPYR